MLKLPNEYESCVCVGNHNPHESCQDSYTLMEKGQVAQLKPKSHKETVKLIVVDGCLIDTKKSSKCDGWFLYEKENGVISSFLVELKNNEKFLKPVEQLEAVKNTEKYKELIEKLSIGKRNEYFFVVSNNMVKTTQKRKIERDVGFRVRHITRTTNTPYSDLKDYI